MDTAQPKQHLKIKPDPRPLYVRAQEALAALLARGAYQVGDKLPAEPLLARQLGISRATLREALRAFEAEGRVKRVRGRGTFVLASPYRLLPGLETLLSVDELLRQEDQLSRTVDLQISHEEALPKAARRLHVGEGTSLVVVSRVCVVGEKRVAFTVDVLPQMLLPAGWIYSESEAAFDSDQLWKALSSPPRYASSRLFALAADEALSRRLEVTLGTPLLFLEQQLFAAEETPVAYGRYYFVGAEVSFQLVRRSA